MATSALKAHLEKYGITGRERQRLLKALGTLADTEGAIRTALVEAGMNSESHAEVCHALRLLVDGPDGEFF